MQIPQNVIEDIINRLDIVDIIGKHLPLKRKGTSYFACCPFHQEKSPSFSVNPSKQIYHCFGCHESGNVISFIMKYNNWDFVDSVIHLANQCGVVIPDDAPKVSKQQAEKQKERKLNLDETISKVVAFYRKQLGVNTGAIEYLKKRGLSVDIINFFNLGYAPDKFNGLNACFDDYENNSFLKIAGLVLENDKSKRIFDRFRDRIIFPIRNVKGNVIAFGGRVIDKGEPKYLNSPETELFNKSLELYGLFESNKSIRNKKYVVVVEGYMDVIALFQYGVDNVVATMGTAINSEHIKRLFKICDDIYYCFDGDLAGRKAAWRALEHSLPLVTDEKLVHFMFLPKEHDPDSFIRERGLVKFESELKHNSSSLFKFLLDELTNDTNISTEEGKARLISKSKYYLDQISASGLYAGFKLDLAKRIEYEPSTVENILNNRPRYAFYNNRAGQNSYQSRFIRNQIDRVSINPPKASPLNHAITALFRDPKLACVICVFTDYKLDYYIDDVHTLFDFMRYFEAHYDHFADIDIEYLVANFIFKGVNLFDIHKKIAFELQNFTSIISYSESQFLELLNKLLANKHYKYSL